MQTNEQCLPADLRAWLLNPDSEMETKKWSRHIEHCQQCRSRMEEQPTALAWPKLLSEDAWDHELSSSPEVIVKPKPQANIDQASLVKFARQVIDKSDNPAMLGRLGEFEILEPIGMGGMSLVLKGYDHELNRFVAIKVLAPHLALVGVARQRFAREAQAAASIVDPHVVPIHSVAADHDPPYLVMTYVPGQTLQATIDAEGSLAVLVAVRIAQQIAMGLAAAHAQGLVHRDIKPSNILLERNVQRAYIVDFGLARAADDASLTRSGFLAGTPDYMSPEQARGESIDARSDLFSLGSVLYTMLAGHPPFRAASPMAVLNRISQDTPRSILDCSPQVPSWLSGFIERLHSKLPEDRFESAAVVGEVLEASLRHLQDPVSCPLPAILVKPNAAPKPRSHWRKVFLAITCCGVVSIACAILWPPSKLAPNVQPLPSESYIIESSQVVTALIKLDLEFLDLVSVLNQEMNSIEKQLMDSIRDSSEIELSVESRIESPVESPAQKAKRNDLDENEAIESEFLDGVKKIEEQLDFWILELKAKGKS